MNKKNYRSSGKARVLLNLLSDGAVIVDGKGNFLVVNDAFEEDTGLSRKELIGNPFFKLNIFTAENKAVLLENLKKRLQGAPVEPYEVCFADKLGEKRCVEVTGKRVSYAGQPASLVVFHDVTDQKKKADEQIRSSEEKYKNLFENAPDVIVTIDLKGKITSVNKAIMQYGFRENEIVGSDIFKLVPVEYSQKLLTVLKSIAAGNPAQGEIEILTPNGKRIAEYNSNPIRLNGKVVGYQTIIRDVTERKKTEEALRESEEKHRKLFEESMDAIFVADAATGIIVDCNPAASKLVDRQKSELVGQHQSIVFPQEQIEGEFTRSFKKHLKDPTKTLETQIMRKTGEIRDVAVKATIFELKGKKLIQGTFRDITEHKKAEAQVLEQLHMLDLAHVIVKNMKDEIIFWNSGTQKLYGFSKEEALGKMPRELLKTKFPKPIEQIKEDLLLTGKWEGQLTHQKADGTHIFVASHWAIHKDNHGKPVAIIEVNNDITERKRLEEELQLHSEIIANMSEGVHVTRVSDGAIVYANRQFEEMFEYAPGGLTGKNVAILNAPSSGKTPEEAAVEIITSLKEKGVWRGEVKNIKKDGSHFWCRANVSTMHSSKYGEVWVAIHDDITERKRSEEELRRAEKKFRIYVENSPVAVFVADPEGKYEYVNEAASKLLGYSAKELMGMGIPQIVFKEEHPTLNGFAALQETGKILVEVRLKKKDGQAVYVNLNAVKLPNGKLIAFCEDITERKHAEEALKESEKKSRAIVANAPIGIATSSADKHFLSANEAFCRILGYTEDELLKLTFKDITHSEDLKESAIKTGELENGRISSFTLEKRYVKKDGTVVDGKIMVSAVRNHNGKPSLFVAELEDITEARRVQDALMESESQYRQLVNVAQEGIWALDSNYRTVFVNPRMANMLGYAESEMVGKSLFEFLNKKGLDQAKQFLGQSKQGFKGHFEYAFARKDGSRVYASTEVSMISDDEGKPSGTLMMVSDITDRKVLQTKVDNYSKHLKSMVDLRTAQLKDANERLVKSERLAAIGELAGMVGHDLRNPLAGIKNAAYFLKKKGTAISEAQAKEMLEIIDKCIDHSDKIINDLLDYSREMHLELTKYAARNLVEEAMGMVQVPDRIQIVNHVHEETWIWVNADKMMRVFVNLIKNAIDAMPEKGTVEISSCQTRDRVEIAFADTGIGIPDETLPKIFSPLFTTKAQGMGFGLAICKRVIESHGGTITVKTAVDKGTTFTITLPIKSKLEVGGEKTWINMPESLLSTTTRA